MQHKTSRLSIVAMALGLFSPVTLSQSATAASFNCSKATTSIERAICTNPGLSRADDTMAAAYRRAIDGLSDTSFKIVRQGQRDWLKYVARVCNDDAKVRKADYDAEGIRCLLDIYGKRTRGLGVNQNAAGLRFFNADTYKAMADTSGDGYSYNGTLVYSSFLMEGRGNLATQFNYAMQQDHSPQQSQAEFDGSSDLEWVVSIDSMNSRRISMAEDYYIYYHGAAHGQFAHTYSHFLINEQRLLQQSDIFASANWINVLDRYIVLLLKNDPDFGEGIWPDLTSVAEFINDPRRWKFSRAGLELQFLSYEVGPYALGAPTVTMPWHELEGLLTSDALRIATGR